MHIPDGFLSTPVWASLDAAAIPAVAYMARKTGAELDDARVPLLGVLGAFVFAAQMINFPVGPGASGHLLGGALLACTVGPASASIVMTAVLAIQAFVFQDGGILALGANIVNLAMAGVLAAYLPYRLLAAGRYRKAGIFLAGFLSVLTSAALALAQILLPGVPAPASVLAVSWGFFIVTAALEGAITLAVIGALERMNPGWIRRPAAGSAGLTALSGAAIALATAGFLVASSQPDVLENAAVKLGITGRAAVLIGTPFADYQAAFVRSEWLSKAAAGVAGLAIVYLLCLGVGRLVAQRRSA